MSTRNDTTYRAVVYARMSTTHQDASIEQQTDWATARCEKDGIEIVRTFIDAGKSGHATSERTGFHAMLAFCQEEARKGRKIDVIVCWHANRFSRADSQETGWFLWEYRKAGVDLMLTAARWIDFTKMEDRVILGIEQDVSSHKFSIDLAHASTRGKLAKAKEGKWCGGRIPFGYRMQFAEGRDGRMEPVKLIPDPESAEVVRWLFETYASGVMANGKEVSLRSLGIDLDRRGVLTPSKRLGIGQQGQRWTVASIRAILTNEKYLGHLVWNRTHQGRFLGVVNLEVVPRPNRTPNRVTTKNDPADHVLAADVHAPLVDRETFEACQRRLISQRRNTSPKRGGTDHTLARLVVCGHCQRRMIGRRKRGEPILVCGTYVAHGKDACNYNPIEDAAMRNAIAEQIEQRFTPEFLSTMREMIAEELASERGKDELAALEARVKDLARKFAAVATRAAEEPDTMLARVFRERALEAGREHAAAEAELARVRLATQEEPDADEVTERAVNVLKTLRQLLASGSPAEVRSVLQDHIEKVEVFFTHEAVRHETHCTFAQAMVYLCDESPLAFCLSMSSVRRGQAEIVISQADYRRHQR